MLSSSWQHLVFEEFACKLAPGVRPFGGYANTVNPSISAEFAHAMYRLGHSMLTQNVARDVAIDIPLLDAFLNPVEFGASGGATAPQNAGNIATGMVAQVDNELDEFVTPVLRNSLVGLPLDLATLNIARGRETGVPRLNDARQDLFPLAARRRQRPDNRRCSRRDRARIGRQRPGRGRRFARALSWWGTTATTGSRAGGGADALIGGNAAPFHLGRDDGHDIMINSPDSDGNEGLFGFDFTTYSRDTVGVDADLAFFPAVPIPGDLRDTFLETEGLSGSNLNDALRGGNATAATMADHALTTPGIITGLPVLLPTGANPFTGGDIILGGGGSDIIQGRAGNDVIDGDALLNVQLDRDGNAGTANANTLAGIQASLTPLTLPELGTMQIRRTVDATVRAGTDTAQYSDVFANCTVTNNAGVLTVAHLGGAGATAPTRCETSRLCSLPTRRSCCRAPTRSPSAR